MESEGEGCWVLFEEEKEVVSERRGCDDGKRVQKLASRVELYASRH